MTNWSCNQLDHFFHLQTCVSYDRVLKITKTIYENLCLPYFSQNCWFANILKTGLLTVLLKDNIDLNTISNFVSSHYHRTSISIIRIVTEHNTGLDFPEVDISQDVSLKFKRSSPLPQESINVMKLFEEIVKSDLWAWAPLCSITVSIDNDSDNDSELKLIDNALNDEIHWLCIVLAAMDDKNVIAQGWSRYHACSKRKPIDPPGINRILP